MRRKSLWIIKAGDLFRELTLNRNEAHRTVDGNVLWVTFLCIGQVMAKGESVGTIADVKELANSFFEGSAKKSVTRARPALERPRFWLDLGLGSWKSLNEENSGVYWGLKHKPKCVNQRTTTCPSWRALRKYWNLKTMLSQVICRPLIFMLLFTLHLPWRQIMLCWIMRGWICTFQISTFGTSGVESTMCAYLQK